MEMKDFLVEKIKNEAPDAMKQHQEFAKIQKLNDATVKACNYTLEFLHLISFILNLYCIYYYEDLYMNVFYTLGMYVLGFGLYLLTIERVKKDQELQSVALIITLMYSFHFVYPVTEGFFLWVGYVGLLFLAYQGGQWGWKTFERKYFGTTKINYKEKLLVKVRQELLNKYTNPEMMQGLLSELAQKNKSLVEAKLAAGNPSDAAVAAGNA